MKKWKLVIWGDGRSEPLEVELQHEYETADMAAREAEHIADHLFEEGDEGWCVSPLEKEDNMSNPIVGQRIVAVRMMTEKELETEYWEHMSVAPVAIVLGNGTTIYASTDEEGNGPGELIHRVGPTESYFIKLDKED